MASPPNKNPCSLGGRCISPWLQLRTWWPSRYLHPPGWYLARWCAMHVQHHQTMERGNQIPLSLGYLCKISPIFQFFSTHVLGWNDLKRSKHLKTMNIGGEMGMGQNPVPLVNPKIAGKWMFIPLKMLLIGIDPYPNGITPFEKASIRLAWMNCEDRFRSILILQCPDHQRGFIFRPFLWAPIDSQEFQRQLLRAQAISTFPEPKSPHQNHYSKIQTRVIYHDLLIDQSKTESTKYIKISPQPDPSLMTMSWDEGSLSFPSDIPGTQIRQLEGSPSRSCRVQRTRPSCKINDGISIKPIINLPQRHMGMDERLLKKGWMMLDDSKPSATCSILLTVHNYPFQSSCPFLTLTSKIGILPNVDFFQLCSTLPFSEQVAVIWTLRSTVVTGRRQGFHHFH